MKKNYKYKKLVQINREERGKGKNCTRRIKQRCYIEFSQEKRTTQNLVDNSRQFEKKSLEPGGYVNMQAQKTINCTTEKRENW